MKVVTEISALRACLEETRRAQQTIGFVPTMGYLHEGHLSLVKKAKEMTDLVVMSIFVNPLQFGPNEDYSRYPRDLERDRRLAEEAGVDLLFAPSVEEMYPVPVRTTVSVSGLSEVLCGKSRPGHFDGVATVVTKLFNIVQPHYAFFGQKDAQQVAVIEQMVADLSIPVTIVPCPTMREADGLAMSSRNVYLNPEERKQATVLYESLQKALQLLKSGERSAGMIRDTMVKMIQEKSLARIDYVEIMTYPQLQPAVILKKGDRICLALAVRFGHTRLIDNLIVTVE